MQELTAAFAGEKLPRRDPWGHKGTFGKVFCLCGSIGFTGAPVFAGRAAVRTGSGLVYLGVPQSIWSVAAVKSDEAMPFPLADQEGKLALCAEPEIRRLAEPCDAVLIGCGLGRSEESDRLIRQLLDLPKPLVLDADGINALAGHIHEWNRSYPTILTPHEGEFSRIGSLCGDRAQTAAAFAGSTGSVLVLKGHRTVVAAPDGRLAVNTTGNSGMAKGGSGDILAGMIVSLLGQGMEPFDACSLAVWIHGAAGDLAAAEKGEHGMTPGDLLERIPAVMRELER